MAAADTSNSPQHLIENILANADKTVNAPPQVAAAATVADLITALSTIGIIEKV